MTEIFRLISILGLRASARRASRGRALAGRQLAGLCGLLLLTAASLLAVPVPVQGETEWDAGTSSWFFLGNWTAGVPDSDTAAIIDNGGTAQVGQSGAEVSSVFVGDSFNGGLEIFNGGSVSGNNAFIAFSADSTGAITVSGANSELNNNFFMVVGNQGTGTLNVQDGGSVNSDFSFIGGDPGASGTVTVSGEDATWTNAGDLPVGSAGDGELIIEAGGSVINAAGSIGDQTGGSGTVTVSGEDSTWNNSDDLFIGTEGTGTLTIEDGGSVSNTVGAIGDQADATGTVTVGGDGTTWNNAGNLFIGREGTGTLNVEAGSNVSNDRLFIGFNGTGNLTIEAGGSVSNTGDAGIGVSGSSTGTVTVSGKGATWTNSDLLHVGTHGTGVLIIEAGGSVSNTNGRIGVFSDDSNGTVTVSGEGATWTNSDDLIVGNAGTGNLTIEAGGSVSNTVGVIGTGASSNSTVTVSGEGATWTNSDDLKVGRRGIGNLTIAGGGTVHVGGAAGTGTVTLAEHDDGAGTINIGEGGAAGILNAAQVASGDGAAVLNFNHNDGNYHFSDNGAAGGNPVVITGSTVVSHIGSGTTILDVGHLYSGATTVTAGTLQVDGSILSALAVNAGGTLAGTGSVGGVTQIAGTVSPGASAGTLNIGSDLTFGPGAVLAFDLDTPGVIGGEVNDLIDVVGDLVLDGTLNVADLGGFDEGAYTLITYTGALTDNGLDIGDLPAGFIATIDAGGGQVQLVVQQQSDEIFQDRFEG